MDVEMNAIAKNETWELVSALKDKPIVDCKWVYTIKEKFDGIVEKYKTKLVAKGYT